MKTEIRFKGKRADTGEWVSGYYFKTPLTDENSGTDPEVGWFFLTGETRHCISTEDGVVFVVDPESVCVDCESSDEHITVCAGDCVYPDLGASLNNCVNCGQPRTIELPKNYQALIINNPLTNK